MMVLTALIMSSMRDWWGLVRSIEGTELAHKRCVGEVICQEGIRLSV